MSPTEAYNELLNISRRLTVFSSFGALLGWDQRTYMPKYAGKYRAMQFAVLREYTYEVLTSEKFGEMLEIAEKGEFGLRERMNIYWWKRAHERLRKIPKELAIEEARVSNESENVWVEAKKTGDFELIKPYIKRIVEIKREIADALGYEGERYNALLDSYEPDLKAEEVERVFSHLKEETLKLLDRVLSSGKASKENLLRGNFPKDKQEEFCNYLLRSIGYDFGRGRLDETIHPFATLITPNDVRITTKYEEEFISPSIFGTLHEMGHGLYDMNLPEDMWGEPVGRAVSLSVHESQSRFWENIIGRSEAFWRRFYPDLQRHFEHFSNIDLEDFLFAINEVKPSTIRIEADELTYNLHIILRFEIERDVINGKFDVEELPELWNEKFKNLFGFYPKNHSEGVLQDIHWYGGSFGYFPTYTLGNIISAQIFAKMKEELSVYELVERGEFEPIILWLKNKIHSKGSLYKTKDLIKEVTGEEIKPEYLVDYLRGKVERFYG